MSNMGKFDVDYSGLEALDDLRNSGELYTMGFDALVESATVASEAARSAEVFDEIIADRVAGEWDSVVGRAEAEVALRRSEYHATTKNGVIRATGISAEDYDDAVMNARIGDPSPLMKLQARYLDSY